MIGTNFLKWYFSRDLVINLETTSRCNRKCVVCPHAYRDSGLVKRDMDLGLVDTLLERVLEARRAGIAVREIINSGYGETLLHREFHEVFEKYAEFKRDLRANGWNKPIVTMVSNAGDVSAEQLEPALPTLDILKLSFPTADEQHYGHIMMGSAEDGPDLMNKAVKSLRQCMEYYRDGRLRELRVHISPPTQFTHEDFPETLQFLTRMAREVQLDNLRIVTFPSTANRAGIVSERETGFLNNFWRAHRWRYNLRRVNGVKIRMLLEQKAFFPRSIDILSVLTHRFPCIWKAGSISIDSSGNYRLCINDAAGQALLGNIQDHSLAEAVHRIRNTEPAAICDVCNQHPLKMGDDVSQRFYRGLARFRMKLGRWRSGKNTPAPEGASPARLDDPRLPVLQDPAQPTSPQEQDEAPQKETTCLP